MSGELSGSISFLDLDTQSSDVFWLCIVENLAPAFPEIRIQRLRKGKLDKFAGKLTLAEGNVNGGSVSATNGEVTLRLSGLPTRRDDRVVWELSLKTRAGGNDVTFVLLGRIQENEPFEQLATVSATSLVRPQLSTPSSVVTRLKESPVPRLSLGINQATPRVPPKEYRGLTPGDGNAAIAVEGRAPDVRALLYRIFFLLDAPATLDAVWDQQSLTKTADSLSEQRFQRDKVRVAEELWARQVTEMLAFTPYGGPAMEYGEVCTDLDLISNGIQRGATRQHYGLFYACQHLANFGVLSRGLQTLPPGAQLNAGSQCAVTVMDMGGKWLNGVTDPQPLTQKTDDPALLTNGPLSVDLTDIITKGADYGPGSLHLFSNRPARQSNPALYEQINANVAARILQGNTSACAIVTSTTAKGTGIVKELCISVAGPIVKRTHARLKRSASTGALFLHDNTAAPEVPHLGFALRVRRNRVQTLDTGGFRVEGRGPGVSALGAVGGFHSGNFDDPLTNRITGTHPYRGTGTFPRPDAAAAEQMRDHVRNVLQRARPLGLARLVLLRRADLGSEDNPTKLLDDDLFGAIRYASPLLTMYLNDASPASEHSNYAISRYMWSLRELPGRELVQAVWMLYVPLRSFARALLDADRSQSALTVAGQLFGDAARTQLPKFVKPVGDVLAQSDGSARIIGPCGRSDKHALHRLEEHGRLPMDTSFPPNQAATFPPYFLG